MEHPEKLFVFGKVSIQGARRRFQLMCGRDIFRNAGFMDFGSHRNQDLDIGPLHQNLRCGRNIP